VTASQSYAELYVPESEAASAARQRAADLGCTPVSAGVATALTFLTAAVRARAVVEVGTGAGISGLHLLAGMAPDGILTTIDVEAEHQRAAKQAFGDAGIATGRTRMINGRALEVLPRLTDGGYDLVLVDTSPADHPRYLDEALRLLRPGGVVAMHGVLGPGVLDPDAADAGTLALREVARQARDDERLAPTLLPLGGGLLTAIRV